MVIPLNSTCVHLFTCLYWRAVHWARLLFTLRLGLCRLNGGRDTGDVCIFCDRVNNMAEPPTFATHEDHDAHDTQREQDAKRLMHDVTIPGKSDALLDAFK